MQVINQERHMNKGNITATAQGQLEILNSEQES